MKLYFLGLATVVVVCVGCHLDTGNNLMTDGVIDPGRYHAPPAALMERPGPMVDGPGPGVLQTAYMASNMPGPGMGMPPGMGGPGMMMMPQQPFAGQTTQIRFVGPESMQVGWEDKPHHYAEEQLTAPGRYNFNQGFIYRLKLTAIPGREGPPLYPTLQVYPVHPATEAYLSHNSVPILLNDEDFQQVDGNNFVTKVIYLPDPQHQELAIPGAEVLVSTRLEPGIDPIAEADRRGTIMAVLRVGNMDLETGLEAPPPGGNEAVTQTNHIQKISGTAGQFAPPMPIGTVGGRNGGVPGPMIMGMPGQPGQMAFNPISGVGPTPIWGMTSCATPIGLPGPPHLPYGGRAGLRSHTVRNLTQQRIPRPTDHVLIDVKHNPGIRLPAPVKHIQYTENHPNFSGPVVQENGGMGGAYCPPQQ
ncbi:MAG: hypothetical protein JWM11_3120 [Planctomycetaceae bacterium]|nr:hypothetical protein [Planctomycetaceae bacterium]